MNPHLTRHRGVTLVELLIVIIISGIVLTSVTWLLVAVARANTNALRDVNRMNDTDVAIQLFQTYGRDADLITLNSATDIEFEKEGDVYRIYRSGTQLLGITPASGGSPFEILNDVSAVTFTQPGAGLAAMNLQLSWTDGMTLTRTSTVYCRNVAE